MRRIHADRDNNPCESAQSAFSRGLVFLVISDQRPESHCNSPASETKCVWFETSLSARQGQLIRLQTYSRDAQRKAGDKAMTPEDIRYLYEYNAWANDQIFDAAAALSAEQFTKDLATSHQSVQGTLAHILAAEWIWMMRCRGTSPGRLFDAAEFPTLQSIREKLDEVRREQSSFIGELTEESLQADLSYTNTKGERWTYPLWQILHHVVNHSSYHRGQVTTMLRQLGAKAVMVDSLYYMDVKRSG